ncbi:CDP-diacylglycerol--glycerol-3-phosphate 3-phosphatidyltransferase [Clostridium acetireducens DSM 10703]|uniref:CDP-diacylglycerol--glycerol-3-phosphate 3-phosphatidyltransferase n=1 Tax=Clostridium acetireducens DSM 10703 TaxID=1121290 RepID=A0A1E8EXY2_9CLOT|nr:CDP-diacylglycerol--glycerol-3-phosphate 3-phosphatidyltransferase [Clostridium acetireducens]OFI05375.1 CDP-diacylglycerol--glycerol-3-phosphate 3-phosphatidyltransferase [Clostridium acetireducens DSM 10703]
MNIPNMLTLFRLFLIPVFAITFFSNIKNSLIFSILIFLLAGFTDILDGYIARKYKLITKCGIILDPLADKLMLITVLTCLTIKSYSPLWILIIVTIKEFSMIIGGAILYNKNTVIPSNKFGKIATLLFYIAIFTMIFNVKIADFLLYIAVFSTIIAFINYFAIYLKDKKETS